MIDKGTMYCLFDPEGKPRINFLRTDQRHCKEDWIPDDWGGFVWDDFYKQGFRIKKVEVTIKVIE